MRRSALALIAIVLVAGSVAACGSSSDRAERLALAALRPPESKPPPPKLTPTVRCRNPYASLRPPAVMPTPGAMPAGSFMARIERRGHLIAGVDQNTLLFAYFDPRARRIVGFEIDMLHQLAKAIFGNPNKVVFKAITTQERVSAVQDGTVDVVADAMTITCARRKDVDFSTVYYDAGQKILLPSNSPVASVKELGGKPVCVTRGSTSYLTLLRLVPRPKPYQVDQRTDCLVALQEGKVAAITSDDSILLGFEAQDPDTKIVGPSFAPEPYGMAISKAHPDFVRFVNGVLAKMRADGTWKTIYKRWLGGVSTSIPAAPRAQYDG
jgi:polar amino acid transport system substrate-binding protein